MKKTTAACLFSLLWASATWAGMPFATLPAWESTSPDDVSTGGALVDLDRDGWLDLVVANGNDMARQPLVVYYNRGGAFSTTPDWLSSAAEYHAHVAAGDVNGDGWIDVAVSVYLGPAGLSEPGWASIYLNDGAGGLPATPSWTSADRCYTFGCALGDADGDGDLDLAVACGEIYQRLSDHTRVYFNEGGALQSLPGWVSDEAAIGNACAFGDLDGDGRLDLVVASTFGQHRAHFQTITGLSTASGWQSSVRDSIGNQLSIGDVNRDGYMDLAIAENNQLGGTGCFVLFQGGAAGLSTSPDWSSSYEGYGADAVIGDANGDGWADLLCGSWGASGVYADAVRIYSSRYGALLDAAASWTSATASVNEKILLGDVDNDGLQPARDVFAPSGGRTLFTVSRTPVHSISKVVLDGNELGPAEFCVSLDAGWISLARAPASALEIDYVVSTRNDLVVTNWDGPKGNYLFYAEAPALLFGVRGATGTELDLQWSNGLPLFDVVETPDRSFGGGARLAAEKLDAWQWSDAPGTINSGSLLFYRVY